MSKFLEELSQSPLDLALIGLGLIAWAVWAWRRASRGAAPMSQLPPWQKEWWQIMLFMLTACFCWVYLTINALNLVKLALGLPDPAEGQPISPALLVASHVGAAAGFLLGYWAHQRLFPRQLPPPPEPVEMGWGRSLLHALPLYFAWYPIVVVSTLLSRLILPEADLQEAVQTFSKEGIMVKIMIFVSAAVLAPWAEETVFRRGLYRQVKSRLGMTNAAALSALVFSVIHLYPVGLLPLFLFGLFLAYAYERHGSIRVAICLHGLQNGISLLSTLLVETAAKQ